VGWSVLCKFAAGAEGADVVSGRCEISVNKFVLNDND